MSAAPVPFDSAYQLDDRYRRESGRVYITGVQALVRLPIMQRQRDLAAGLNTAGFISGYRGSPLGTYDLALWRAKDFLESHHVRFEPGVNEDLAATAVWGSQQIHNVDGPRYDGVFGIWYGKGPGVDRSCDAIKHGNYSGTAPHGGVLAFCGDDPGAKSSSIQHQSEQVLVHMGMPILNPSNVQEYLDYGLFGWGLSRYASCWVGFKCLTDTVESAGSVSVDPERVRIVLPETALSDAQRMSGTVAAESDLYHVRLPAAQAFARANGLDRVVIDSPRRRLGIVTTGKAYLDVRQALDALGIDEARAAELGLSVYKVALSWPLEPEGALAFADGLEEILCVEEKRPLVQDQLAALLYNLDRRPRLLGKRDEAGAPLVPDVGELSPQSVEDAIRGWLQRRLPEQAASLRPASRVELPVVGGGGLMRMPTYCSGCPHNSSTLVPDGSVAGGGIGCHGMSSWMPSRRTVYFTHMGGEGANWVGVFPFTDTEHIFQNIGDGTYFHSGLLAIRANVTAGTNITYKVLVNGAVAMTGGQPVEGQSIDGTVTTPDVVHQLLAEGVKKVVVVSNDIAKYRRGLFPPEVEVKHRDELIRVQKNLRGIEGVTALVYDQTCAAEARRLRKRGELPDPDRRVVINELVCEGCGDCSVQSNCISIEPVETTYGRKRRINQSTCNKDYSCVKGYCPSFANVIGGKLRKVSREGADTGGDALFADLPEPELADASRPVNVLVAGIGGSGVVTIGALLGMAAHLEGKGCSVLDVTGLAQKNGPVTSHVRIADDPEDLHATRLSSGGADLLLACDIVVGSNPDSLAKLSPERSLAIVNTDLAPTSDFTSNPDLDLSTSGMEKALKSAAGEDGVHLVPTTRLATALMGDAIATNLFAVGYAYQLGRLPLGQDAIERAIELNGVAVEMNKRAFAWGRLAAHDMARVEEAARPPRSEEALAAVGAEALDELVAARADFLSGYQNTRYAERYLRLVDTARQAEERLPLSGLEEAVARYGFKLMAYKDEYEIARLWTLPDFRRQLEAQFEGDYRVEVMLAPQFFNRRDPDTGQAKKFALGPWVFAGFRLLAALKFLRSTPLDIFGWTPHRRRERALIDEYERTVAELCDHLGSDNHDLAVQIASLPEHIRGYDTVKDRHIDETEAKRKDLLAAFHLRAPTAEPAA